MSTDMKKYPNGVAFDSRMDGTVVFTVSGPILKKAEDGEALVCLSLADARRVHRELGNAIDDASHAVSCFARLALYKIRCEKGEITEREAELLYVIDESDNY